MSRQRSMEVIEQAEYVTIGELVRLTAVNAAVRAGRRESDQKIPQS